MIILADKGGCVDSSYHTLVKHIDTDIPIVMVSWSENFEFNHELLNLTDYILICFCEYGYDFDLNKSGSHIWGFNSKNFSRYYNGDWIVFDNWVNRNPPKLMLKRELLVADVSDTVKPIDYTATTSGVPLQTKEEFNNRLISACYYWGRSHEDRLRLHGEIWQKASQYGYSVCDNLYYLNGFLGNEQGKKYVSLNIPHYQRHPIENLLQLNGMSKIGISVFGAGRKCFRHTEVSSNAVMLMWEDNLEWSYEWVHGFNCLKCKQGEEIETIEKWVNDERLYSIYLEGVSTWEKYQTKKYIDNYLTPLINAAK